MFYYKWIFTFSYFVLHCINLFGYDDSTGIAQRINLQVAGSFMNAVNWQGNNTDNYYCVAGAEYGFIQEISEFNLAFDFKTELGYMKLVDSIWLKHADVFRIQFLARRFKKKYQQSWSFHFNTQLLNSYDYSYGFKQTGTFLNPADLECGYGVSISLPKNNFINISFATIRIRSRLKTAEIYQEKEETIARFHSGYLIVDYGLSGKVSIIKQFSDLMEWSSNGKFFVNGFNKNKTTLDFSNKMKWKIWKFLQVKGEISCMFDPSISNRMQYRGELLIGFFYEWESSQ